MYAIIKKISWILLVVACLIPPHTIQAANRTPNSHSFGYGVRVNLQGADPISAIQEAAKYNLDLIAVDIDWQRLQPRADVGPDWQELDGAMALAAEYQLTVLISITQAPTWAMGQTGPSSEKTADLIKDLIHRYPDTVLAIEIFPGANTEQGWGSTPNPEAYSHLLKTISQTIAQDSSEIVTVAVGLTPVAGSSQGMDDLSFLRQIYTEGIAEFVPLVGLRLPPIGMDPLTRSDNPGSFSLRHYEDLRKIMEENGHKNGLIWITGFSWEPHTLNSPNEQAAWMKQAYLLFRSQLYIGAAFFNGMNASHIETPALLLEDGNYHPGFEELIQIIAQDHNTQTIVVSHGSIKRISSKNYSKVINP